MRSRTRAVGRRSLRCLLLLALLLSPAKIGAEPPVLLGVYPWGDTLQAGVANVDALDAWIAPTGVRIGLFGDFIDIEYVPFFTVPFNLGSAWDSGRIPFVKLLALRTSDEINGGAIDDAIIAWGQSFAAWSQGGTKRAFIALLPEMNGNWIPYYDDPGTVVQAYRRIRNLIRAQLAAAGVPQNAISWVFAPNGWSAPDKPSDMFENFYPGPDEVDVVGFSAYNWGGCPPWNSRWETYALGFEPYLHRMRAMAPGKPIFIVETAVIDRMDQPMGDRDEWFRDTYTRLAAFPRLRGIVYFDKILPTQPNLSDCPNPDFRLHVPGTDRWQGFIDALNNPASNFGYWAPTSPEVASIVFAPTVSKIFADVLPIHPFALEPGEVDFSPWIHTLAESGITTGCGANPPRFCPTAGVTRDQMAVFLLRGIHGSAWGPPPAAGGTFVDVVPGNPFAPWIEQLAREGITGGCGASPPRYCPGSPVTRAQMAVFLLRAKHGSGYAPPAATGMFADVPVGSPFAAWIEQLAREGITGGCGGGKFCPDAIVTREQMAVFLVRAFGL